MEELPELEDEPYNFFEMVDYRRVMALRYPSIRIDVYNECCKNEKRVRNRSHAPKEGDNSYASSDDEDEEGKVDINIVYLCGLIIDIEAITKKEILKLRKLLPRTDYR